MRLHATATTKTTTTKTTTTTTTTKAAAVTKRQRNNTKANTTTKSRTTTNLTTNSSNFMRDFLLQIFVLTTFVAACPFSVYPIVTKAMPQTLIDTNTNNNNNNNDNNNNNAESAATIKNNAATATTTDTLVAAPTIVAHYAKFATDTPNILLPTLDLDSNEIDNSYFSDYVIANQPISTTTTTTVIATATATKTTPQTAITTTTTTIGTSLNATHINAKSKDLLSLSLLSLNETTTSLLANVTMIAQQQHQQQHQKIAASHKNAINDGNGNSNSNSAATIATVFQQIGAQNIALEPAITSDNNNNDDSDDNDNDYDDNNNNNDDAGGGVGQHTAHNHAQYTMHNSQSHSHSHIQNNRPAGASATIATSSLASAAAMPSATSSSTGNNNNNNKSNIRTSAKKVESKYILPKPQKTDAPMLNYIFDTHSSANKHHHHDQRYGPHFEDVESVGQPTNLTVQAGSSIHLNCRISLLHDKTVSWVRRNALNEKDALDLLTVGQVTYTGDKRYKMEFQYPNNWRLKITNVKKDDEAMYECQISTHPPRVIQINLHVNAPKVMIVDEYGDPLQEKYYETDSTLQLSCVVRNVAMASSVVYWKHGEDVLNYDVTRGGVSVKTELMDDGANSTLFIAKINKTDSGNYTCSISDFQNFTIVVHILNGESFAELHHGGAATSYAILPSTVALIILLLYCATLYTEAHIHR